MSPIFILLCAIAGGLLNAARGVEGYFSAVIAALLGLMVYLLTLDPIAAGLSAVAFFGGESMGWGKWLLTVPHWGDKTWQEEYNSGLASRKEGRKNGIHAIASAIADEREDFETYAKVALVLRGFYWWAPVFGVLVYFGAVNPVGAGIALAFLSVGFPLAYYLGTKIDVPRIKLDKVVIGGPDGWWSNGELFYGLMYGAAVSATLFI